MQEQEFLNPALKQFSRLVGEWRTSGVHPYLPGETVVGHATFEWMEDGAFLIWRSSINEEHFPNGSAIFASDDATREYFMLYFDDRRVSRKYNVSFADNVLTWWRNAPGFSQRYSWTFTDNDNTIIGKGELCKDGKSWEKDLEQTFTRIL